MTPVQYFQTDGRWSSISYSAPGESTTIGKAGCGITCAAMVIAALKDPNVTPVDTAKWSLRHGYKVAHQGTAYTYFVPQLKEYGINCVRLNTSNIYKLGSYYAKDVRNKITDCLKMHHWVIACMGKGNWTSSGHYVLAYKADNSSVYIFDPASTKKNRTKNSLELWESEIKYAWEIVPQTDKKEDDEVIENKKTTILGKEINVPTIFKDGANYVSIRALCEAMGLKVTSDGGIPIVSTDEIKVKAGDISHKVSGMNSGGTTYAGIRAIAEMLGYKVSWDDKSKCVVINM